MDDDNHTHDDNMVIFTIILLLESFYACSMYVTEVLKGPWRGKEANLRVTEYLLEVNKGTSVGFGLIS